MEDKHAMENTELTLKQENISIDVDDIDVAAILMGRNQPQVSTNAKVHYVESGVVIIIAPDFY